MKVVGYYGNWAQYEVCPIDQIDPHLFTHIIYSFAKVTDDGEIVPIDKTAALELGGYKKFNALKKQNKRLKTLLAIGGWTAGCKEFSRVASRPHLREKFCSNAIDLMDTYGFDGIDIDWEYPAAEDREGSSPQDKKNFTLLLQEMRRKFDDDYLLSVAVSAGEYGMNRSYEVSNVSDCVDFINLMTYDFHSNSDGKTGANAPLSEVKKSVNAWINKGADPRKLILGIGAYGQCFKLRDHDCHGMAAPCVKLSSNDEHTMSLTKIREIKNDWHERWDDDESIPYIFKKDKWISYDNTKSVSLKIKYAARKGLGGGMIWSIDTDCPLSSSPFRLTRAIKDAWD